MRETATKEKAEVELLKKIHPDFSEGIRDSDDFSQLGNRTT